MATPTVSLNPYPERSMIRLMQEDRISQTSIEANPLESGHFQAKKKMGDIKVITVTNKCTSNDKTIMHNV